MDDFRFDALTKLLARDPSRRGLLASVLAAFALAPQISPAVAKKKHHKKKKKKKTPPPTCFDGKKNGNETGVDCGGPCKRCGEGQQCKVANDCTSGTCTGGKCVACTPLQLCGSDQNGACRCDTQSGTGLPVCDSQPLVGGVSVMDCSLCPLGTETCVFLAPVVFNCYKRCGSP